MAFAFNPRPVTAGLLCILLLFTICPETSIPQQRSMMPDQVNTDSWDGAWTNLVNDVRQSFKPALPKLEAVEVELVLGNPGNAKDRLTLTVLDAGGTVLSTVSKVAEAEKCDHVLFTLSNGGLDVTPGQTYALKLSGGTTFGWKYIVDGYDKGAASFNGRPLLSDARSTFLFRTFGSK